MRRATLLWPSVFVPGVDETPRGVSETAEVPGVNGVPNCMCWCRVVFGVRGYSGFEISVVSTLSALPFPSWGRSADSVLVERRGLGVELVT